MPILTFDKLIHERRQNLAESRELRYREEHNKNETDGCGFDFTVEEKSKDDCNGWEKGFEVGADMRKAHGKLSGRSVQNSAGSSWRRAVEDSAGCEAKVEWEPRQSPVIHPSPLAGPD